MIKLRKPPQKPQGRKILKQVEIQLSPKDRAVRYSGSDYVDDDDYDYENVPNPSLAEIVKYFEDRKIDLSEVIFTHWAKYDSVMQDMNPRFSFTLMEPQEEYDKRVRQYKQEYKLYRDWYKENKDEIKAAKAAIKAEKDKEKQEKSLAAKKRRLKRQREKIEHKLKELGQNGKP